jgi:cystine transport system substrate-binding protein
VKKLPRLALVGVIAATAIALSACSSGTSGAGGSSDSGADTSLADVQAAGEIIIATEGTYRPFSFHEGGSGELTGYDVELATAVAEKLGVEPKFEETQWDAIFAGLDAGRFDLIANQVSITPDREEKYVLSEPYTVSPGAVIVSKDNTDITSLADLAGRTTAQSLSSNWYELAEASGATVQGVEGWSEAVSLLEDGRIDATINDKLIFLDYKATNAEEAAGLKIAAETDDPSQSAFVAAGGSSSLIDAIDDALDELRADGTIATLSEKYFGEDVSQ